jgi:N6-adenosine-specific RNA methylase IME4
LRVRHPAGTAKPASSVEVNRPAERKPDEAYELIERMYPTLPKIELFARQNRPGWVAWGNEIASAPAA